MKRVYLIPLALAAIVAGTSVASAQGFRDDPPGWAFQKRGIIESNGGDPFDYQYRGRRSGWNGYGWNGWGGAYAWAPGRHHYRHHRNWRHR